MKWGSCFVCGFVTRRFFQISHTLLKLFIGCCRFDITRQFILTLLVSLLYYYVTMLLYYYIYEDHCLKNRRRRWQGKTQSILYGWVFVTLLESTSLRQTDRQAGRLYNELAVEIVLTYPKRFALSLDGVMTDCANGFSISLRWDLWELLLERRFAAWLVLRLERNTQSW